MASAAKSVYQLSMEGEVDLVYRGGLMEASAAKLEDGVDLVYTGGMMEASAAKVDLGYKGERGSHRLGYKMGHGMTGLLGYRAAMCLSEREEPVRRGLFALGGARG